MVVYGTGRIKFYRYGECIFFLVEVCNNTLSFRKLSPLALAGWVRFPVHVSLLSFGL